MGWRLWAGGVVVVMVLLGCGQSAGPEVPAGWVVYDARGVFTFRGPADLKDQQVQGIDSFVGEYRSDRFEVYFDYGIYGGDFKEATYEKSAVVVGGHAGTLARWDGGVGLYLGDLEKGTRLSLMMQVKCKVADAREAEALLWSVRFGKAREVVVPFTAPATGTRGGG